MLLQCYQSQQNMMAKPTWESTFYKTKKSILLESFSVTVDVGRSKCEKWITMTAQLHRDITINNSKYEGWCCGPPPSYLNQLMHFSLTSGSIRHADRSFWHLRSTFPYIHTGTIINRDKQSKITHLPCCFSTLFSLASHSSFDGSHLVFHTLKPKRDKPSLSGALTWQKYISDTNNSRLSYIYGNVTCHYLYPRPVNEGREQQWK